MKQKIYLTILCVVLTMMAACTHSSETKDDEKAKAAWQRYYEAYDAKNLKRALAVIDSMETEKIVSTPKADHLRGLVYDQGWQMKIAPQTPHRIGAPIPMRAIAGHVCVSVEATQRAR